MSVLLLIALALPGGLVTALLVTRRRLAFAVGLATALACVIAAASIDAADQIPLAGSAIGGSDGLRTLTVAWAATTLLFGIIDGLIGVRPLVLGPSLIGLAFGAAGLGVADPGIGFAILTGGAVLVAVVPLAAARPAGESVLALGVRSVRYLVAAGFLSLLVVAWGASPAGPLEAVGPLGDVDPSLELAMGLALMAMVGAVVIRSGAIPSHIWAARYAEAMPTSAVPPMLGWGAAAFGLVALGWVDVTISPSAAPLETERLVIALVASATIILAGIAAGLHDDIEHVLAYAIIQDAGVAILAFASAGQVSGDAARDWILAAVAVKAGLAAWVLVARATFGTRDRTELRGWARRAPLLGLAFALVLIGAIGLPGVANFDARATLIQLALPGPIAAVVVVAAFAPLIFLGRIMAIGFGVMSGPVRGASGAEIVLGRGRTDGWADDLTPARTAVAVVRANRYPLAAAAAVLVAVVGLSIALGGLGSSVGGAVATNGGGGPAIVGP